MLCKKIDFKFNEVKYRVPWLTKTLGNLHVYFDGDYNIDNLSRLPLYITTASTQML